MLQACRFALDPSPAQARLLASNCGAARKAFNEALARVRRCLDQREAERSYGVPDDLLTEVPWTLPALRRWWNLAKEELAPWWAENSKEAYNSGLDALARDRTLMNVREITAAVGVGQSTVSAHLKVLAAVRFLLADPHGAATYYRINPACVDCFPTAADLVMGKPAPAQPAPPPQSSAQPPQSSQPAQRQGASQ